MTERGQRTLAGFGHRVADAGFAPVVIVLLALYMAATNDVFATWGNITNVLLQVSVLAISAFGMCTVIIAGQLDLSQGSVVALVGVVAADNMVKHGLLVGLIAGIAVGVGVGLFNGWVTAWLGVPSFITTLGMLVIARGLAREITAGNTVGGLPTAFTDFMQTEIFGLRMPIYIAVVFGVFIHLLLKRTRFGVHVFAIGGNSEATRRSGVHVRRVLLGSFVVSGVAMAVAGLTLLGRVEAGQPNAATLLELYAVAGVVLGGTRLSGGQGSIPRTVAGVILIGLIQNAMNLKGISANYQQVVLGLVFILAMTADAVRSAVSRAREFCARAVRRPPVNGPARVHSDLIRSDS